MRILLVTQYFWPESFPINDLARLLREHGLDVTVLTGKPNYPSGRLFPGYRATGRMREIFGGIPVLRVPLIPRGQSSRLGLVLNYLSFIVSAGTLGRGMLRGQPPFDVVFVYAPSPLLQALAAVRLARLLEVPLVVWVQDLWPESLPATGYVKNALLLRLVTLAVKRIYRACDRILVQSRAFVAPVAALTDQPDKVRYYPNLYQPNVKSAPSAAAAELAERLRLQFSVVFAGNLGTAQALDTVIEAARRLRPHRHVQIVLVGSGSLSPWLARQREMYQLDNLVLVGRFEASDMPTIFDAASALLVTLSADQSFALTVPSKVQAYLAAGRPIVASLDGEAARIIDESGAGFCSIAGNAEALAETILRMTNTSRQERETMGQRGRIFFDRNFASDHLVRELETHLIEVVLARKKPK
ncbi:MAG: glycosyltransferase family 4 protein [Hydrogenophaga sp.]|uniref:glycosyltransferase family 4 protein n=1 Tax=Hydrogenophaga sp. TaxID=1904254 RepID=UPI002ABC1A65|nr:glycosyltransferase family 4 protein [Hydrogenophaga sp.]MDZ4101085.1 glycosyltransferase family 4 protein [Hydrogenophaga sp.]